MTERLDLEEIERALDAYFRGEAIAAPFALWLSVLIARVRELKQQAADDKLAFDHAQEIVGEYIKDEQDYVAEIAELKAKIAKDAEGRAVYQEQMDRLGAEIVRLEAELAHEKELVADHGACLQHEADLLTRIRELEQRDTTEGLYLKAAKDEKIVALQKIVANLKKGLRGVGARYFDQKKRRAKLEAELAEARVSEQKWLEAYQGRVKEMDDEIARLRAALDKALELLVKGHFHEAANSTPTSVRLDFYGSTGCGRPCAIRSAIAVLREGLDAALKAGKALEAQVPAEKK